MKHALSLLDARGEMPALSVDAAQVVADELSAAAGLAVYPKSIVAKDGRVYFLGRRGDEKVLGIFSRAEAGAFAGEVRWREGTVLTLCPRSAANLAALRAALPWLRPICLGIKTSIGMGDRLGLATPGHIRAVRGAGVAPIVAQQSIREMTRTHRTAPEVMDDATWGVFEAGWRDGFGSDADHLKTTEDIDVTFACGFTLFTIDPGAHVDNAAGRDAPSVLRDKLKVLPWSELECTEADFRKAFCGKAFQIGDATLTFSEEDALRAAAKYGRAVAHTVKLNRHLASIARDRPFELEMSVDETDSPTTVHEHFYVAHELRRLGVKYVALAPRFIGDFEKGIDYKGDLAVFEREFILHAQIARDFGPYKISIHSGSDKFSIYPIVARHTRGLVHVKTAGTSYLEATRTIAQVNPALFREILAFAFERYNEDKASYHVSADLAKVRRPESLKDEELGSVLDINDGRQLLHVTFGSVLTGKDAAGNWLFRDRFFQTLRENEETHYAIVAAHLARHIAPLKRG